MTDNDASKRYKCVRSWYKGKDVLKKLIKKYC